MENPFNTLYTTRTLVFLEEEPQSNKYRQVILTREQYKKVTKDISEVTGEKCPSGHDSEKDCHYCQPGKFKLEPGGIVPVCSKHIDFLPDKEKIDELHVKESSHLTRTLTINALVRAHNKGLNDKTITDK